ncbi:SDR family NAD(P)-dependent oxidoreductase [Geothrix sp. 21YS21S-2]|uniref:SDR family NAD(P)-dependent oxidoreductase n=1 Tax=Geothrix sp. 21YS21S-2 TaxID=3068893 RepID=UPI0027BAFE82|nr:glucose 1-dehydrogenase [Geothrix sp. 21YS21S-2]
MSEMTEDFIKNLFNLEGKVAIVTGGAGALGESICEGLAAYGADIVVTGRTLKTLDEAVARIEKYGRKAVAIPCDVSREEDVVRMVATVMEKFGKIDILFTVAGIAKRYAAEDFPVEEFDQVMNINVRGTFLACKHVGRVMKEQKSGKIVTISSVRGFAGHPGGYVAYGPSKAAVDGMTKQLSTEWAKYGITVNAIAPTIFWTPLTQQVLQDEKLKKIFLDRIPLGRAAMPADMVGISVYFASAASDFISGQILYVDGGLTAG